MRKFGRRVIATALCCVLSVSAMTGCSKKEDATEKKGVQLTTDENSVVAKLPKDIKGDISIMLWAGDSKDYKDIGHMDLDKDTLTSQNVASVYAVAKKFNETYPNVTINLWAKTGDPNQYNTPSWDQEIENFKTKNGKYPDIWASTGVVNDIKKGIVADLSVFKDDSTYKQYNQTLMGYMNYYGFQAGLPSYSIPWGVWVNKSLAEQNNISVPDPDWDIDDYTKFITKADNKEFWGTMGAATAFIETGTKDINYMIANYDGSGEYVNITTDAVQDLLEYIPKWVSVGIDAQAGLGAIDVEIIKESAGYDWNYFCNNRLLTLERSPWQMTSAADPAAKGVGTVSAEDWDIYPRPATDECDPTVGIVVDPICIHNYAADDKNMEWSQEEKDKLTLTYAFAQYWTASSEAKKAIAEQEYKSGTTYKSAMNDSFPVVTGDLYDEQMEIWYSIPAHERYADADKMPGFQKVVEIFKDEEATWDYSDKCFPCTITEEGDTKACLYEWQNMWNGDIAGSFQTEESWVNDVKAKLSDWNTNINERFAQAQVQLQEALVTYYGFDESAFTK